MATISSTASSALLRIPIRNASSSSSSSDFISASLSLLSLLLGCDCGDCVGKTVTVPATARLEASTSKVLKNPTAVAPVAAVAAPVGVVCVVVVGGSKSSKSKWCAGFP